MASDVRVFVKFKERCIFAGEEVDCIITFKNVADAPETPSTRTTSQRGGPLGRVALSNRGHAAQKSWSAANSTKSLHQSTFSLTSPPTPRDIRTPAVVQRPNFKHQRSLSIVSGASASASSAQEIERGPHQPALGHRRSSTVHLAGGEGRRSNPTSRQSSSDLRVPARSGRRSPLAPTQSASDFKFPVGNNGVPPATPLPSDVANHSFKGRPLRQSTPYLGYANSDRESVDIYSHSDHSGETLVSEQASMVSERPQIAAVTTQPLQRSGSLAIRRPRAARLLMGYAQVGATFLLDGSLVDQTPFEEVKKKGFLGGQAGGGVVGAKKKARPGSGLFGAFNFSSLGESLESIMGGDNLSSIKEMKAVTNSRAIPLLSTPQSLLFVDLQLEPGEEKSYTFAYKVPKGLPSSYRGKAIKIAYYLTIGVQSDPGKREMQAVRQVNIPLRVFSGVDLDGEIFGHDLMQPYVVLKDTARTKLVDPSREENNLQRPLTDHPKMTAKDFLRNVDTLLDRKRRRQSSTTTIDLTFGASEIEGSATIRAINRAIMISNQLAGPNEASPNRFEITRSGLAIATVILDRPLHRLGETVTTIIDFAASQMTCTSLRATLESAERVEASLAIRSSTAISRISKRVYGSQSENVLFSRRAVFCPTIPVTATPTFVTSGVSLDWYIKLEFGTVAHNSSEENDTVVLLEEVMKDERGTINIAVESLNCDTFEVSIPITVYGDIVMDSKDGNEVNGIAI